METLKERISKEFMESFKNKETIKKNLLGVVKGEITTQEKNAKIENLPDLEVNKILIKIAKSLRESIESGSVEAGYELTIIEAFLPKQMSESEVLEAVSNILSDIGASSPSDMGKVMTAFNLKFMGQADGKTVSKIVRELLTIKA